MCLRRRSPSHGQNCWAASSLMKGQWSNSFLLKFEEHSLQHQWLATATLLQLTIEPLPWLCRWLYQVRHCTEACFCGRCVYRLCRLRGAADTAQGLSQAFRVTAATSSLKLAQKPWTEITISRTPRTKISTESIFRPDKHLNKNDYYI